MVVNQKVNIPSKYKKQFLKELHIFIKFKNNYNTTYLPEKRLNHSIEVANLALKEAQVNNLMPLEKYPIKLDKNVIVITNTFVPYKKSYNARIGVKIWNF